MMHATIWALASIKKETTERANDLGGNDAKTMSLQGM
jgi:hypothetical protein